LVIAPALGGLLANAPEWRGVKDAGRDL